MGLECTERTIRNAMSTMNFHKCIACRKGWVNDKTARRRVEWATNMLAAYPNEENWYRVRFSDEVHFEYGPQEKLRIIRRPDERYCQDCIQEASASDEKELKKMHC